MDFAIKQIDLVVYSWKELDIAKTKMIVVLALSAGDRWKRSGPLIKETK